jgi:hypothetical protein
LSCERTHRDLFRIYTSNLIGRARGIQRETSDNYNHNGVLHVSLILTIVGDSILVSSGKYFSKILADYEFPTRKRKFGVENGNSSFNDNWKSKREESHRVLFDGGDRN